MWIVCSETTSILSDENKIQIVISRSHINFGMSQHPKIDDYADGVDVFKWLNDLT